SLYSSSLGQAIPSAYGHYATAATLIVHLKKKGVKVVLLSHNIEPLIKQYAKYFNVPYVCLSVKPNGNRCEVDLSKLADFKLREIQKYDPSKTIAIGDSKHDFPVLNYVKYPIVVCHKKEKWIDNLQNKPLIIPV
ncbi:haloacid dehalogenase-like hydrolase, partial [Effusibacillus consociatus]